jgi:hypothetical protein
MTEVRQRTLFDDIAIERIDIRNLDIFNAILLEGS